MEYTKQTDTTNFENQDRAEVFQTSRGFAFVLADGSGGIGEGAEAAQAVIERLQTANSDDFIAVFSEIDNAITADTNAGETTAVYVTLRDNLLSGVSVGDSEVWLVKDH